MRPLAVIFLVFGLSCHASAQISIGQEAGWQERIFFGGGLGLNGGTDVTGNRYLYFQVSPIIGYMITPSFSGGVGITYAYISYPDVELHTSEYGMSPFLRYNIKQFFAQLEYNMISVDPVYDASNERTIYDRFFAGLGISQPIGRRGAINFVAMYDLLYEPGGVFRSPWDFRVYFSF